MAGGEGTCTAKHFPKQQIYSYGAMSYPSPKSTTTAAATTATTTSARPKMKHNGNAMTHSRRSLALDTDRPGI